MELKAEGVKSASVIGRLETDSPGRIWVEP
ncbi:MAG: hypothetical protein U0V70_14685 [Terriglobia bacterium]